MDMCDSVCDMVSMHVIVLFLNIKVPLYEVIDSMIIRREQIFFAKVTQATGMWGPDHTHVGPRPYTRGAQAIHM